MEPQQRKTTIEDAYPLSPMQQGMLFHSLLAPDSGVDIEQLYCELHEALDVAAFQRSWRCVIERHPILRTSFSWQGVDEPLTGSPFGSGITLGGTGLAKRSA